MNKSGIILIVIGCLFLAGNLGWLRWSWLQQWWPLILIGGGLWLVLRERRAPGDDRQDRDAAP